jgi:AbrB family looped-hinge helix DNA binding protein
MKKLVKPLRHGQITIPKEFREALALGDQDLLSISLVDGKLEVEPVRVEPRAKGSRWAKKLHAEFAPVRKAFAGRSEKGVNEAIDKAVKEVRARGR